MKNGVHNTWEAHGNTFYNFLMEFDNGDTGLGSSKKPEGSWTPGKEYTYELIENDKGNIIKAVKPVEGYNSPAEDKSIQAIILAQSSMKSAIKLINYGQIEKQGGGKFTLEDVPKLADWLIDRQIESAKRVKAEL